MGLYHTYRPSTIDEMMGNTAQLKAVVSHFKQPQEKWAHAHCLEGPSGTGKTTLARIIAKDILGADDMTIKELNTADERGIPMVREIIEQMKMRPLGGKPLIFIIDEAQRLTTDAKSAFLKPLEDTPKHVYFFFCTTYLQELLKGDVGKALDTRFTHWKLSSLENSLITRLVNRVARAEKIQLTERVVSAIVETAEGSPRKALVALEKIAPICFEDEQLEVLTSDLVDDAEVRDLCQALLKQRWKPVADILKKLQKQKVEPESCRRAVLGYMTAVVLNSGDANAAAVLEAFSEPTYDTAFPGIVLNAYLATHPDN